MVQTTLKFKRLDSDEAMERQSILQERDQMKLAHREAAERLAMERGAARKREAARLRKEKSRKALRQRKQAELMQEQARCVETVRTRSS